MSFDNVLSWLQSTFKYTAPEEYVEFLRKENFSIKRLTAEKYSFICPDDGGTLSIEGWYTLDNLLSSYENGIGEDMPDYYLPIFYDGGANNVFIDCRVSEKSYGNLVYCPCDCGWYDDEKGINVWEYDFIAPSFTEFMKNLI
jgi:hypothetical protein